MMWPFFFFVFKYDMVVLLTIDVIEKIFFYKTLRQVRYFHLRHNNNDQINTTPKE